MLMAWHGDVIEKADNDFRETGDHPENRHDAFVCEHGRASFPKK
jgi:hypothetical protein